LKFLAGRKKEEKNVETIKSGWRRVIKKNPDSIAHTIREVQTGNLQFAKKEPQKIAREGKIVSHAKV